MDNFQSFTGFQYLLIDAANNFGLDKRTFDERLDWATDYLDDLEVLAQERSNWKDKPLYLKAVQAIRKAQAGIPTGHLVGFDAVCSGMQIMSVLTGCPSGARATGLIDTGLRPDAYTDCTDIMSNMLGRSLPNMRDHVKQAVMTCLYGSSAEPEKEFGAGTHELNTFYRALYQLAPGACHLLSELLASWQSMALLHEWILPDGYHARVKVIQTVEKRIEVDELNHASFTYQYSVNEGEEAGVKNAANVIHSIDAYILRTLVRRCNYDADQVQKAIESISAVLLERALAMTGLWKVSPEIQYYKEQYDRSGVIDITCVEYLDWHACNQLETEHLIGLRKILETMTEHKPFEVVTVHDDFKCHPNHMNHLRKHYRQILAELADSELMSDIMTQLHDRTCHVPKFTNNLSALIKQSNYALT